MLKVKKMLFFGPVVIIRILNISNKVVLVLSNKIFIRHGNDDQDAFCIFPSVTVELLNREQTVVK